MRAPDATADAQRDDPARPPVQRPRDHDPPAPRSWDYQRTRAPYSHLAKRFFASLSRRSPSVSSRAWADATLNPGERRLFAEMKTFDQRHAIGVAREVYERTGDALCARAALMHDVGKLDCRLGPVLRSVATVTGRYLPVTADTWSRRWWRRVGDTPDGRLRPVSWRERMASYWMHPWEGRLMLDAAGADPYVSAWAEQHHHQYCAVDLLVPWAEACVMWDADSD